MPTTLYAVTPDGNVWEQVAETQVAGFLFNCAVLGDQPAVGIASTSTEIVILKNDGSEAVLIRYGRNGQYLDTLRLTVGLPMKSLAFWPGNPNLLLTTSAAGIYVLSINPPLSVHFIPATVTRGIAAVSPLSVNPTVASFYIGVNGVIRKVAIDRSAWTLSDQGAYARRLHPATTGLATTTLLYAVNPDGNRTILHTFAQGIPTTGNQKHRLGDMLFLAADLDAPVTAGSSPTATVPTVPSISTRLYAADGSLTVVEGVNFGVAAPTKTTSVSIVGLKVEGVTTISNVSIGLTESPATVLVAHQTVFDPTVTPTNPFPGISDGSSSVNNVSVGTLSGIGGTVTQSDYVYLAAVVPPKFIGPGRITFRWYFDFE